MIIKRIRLHNFRQFYGKQELEFGVDGSRNVTLIHAENGFGKTSILNAVLWALFNQVTPKFEKKDDIVNYAALEEGERTASVEVEFEFKRKQYIVHRKFFNDRDTRDKTELAAYAVRKGSVEPLNAAETFVASVVPPEMAKYFFFDGEAAETFASGKSSKEVQAAIRNILGCSLAETAMSDLRELVKNVDREMGDVADDNAISALEQKIQAKATEIDEAVKARELAQGNIETWRAQCSEILARLREMQGAEEIQKLRDAKVQRCQQLEAEIAQCEVETLKWIGQRAIQVVSRRLAQTTLEFVDEASLRGRIPAPYNDDFVRGLLKAQKCVCDRPLVPATKEWATVADLLKTASNAEVLGRVIRARARTQLLREEAPQAPVALAQLRSKVAHATVEKGRLEQEIEELSKKIEGLPIKEIAERERTRRMLETKIDHETQALGAVRLRLTQLEKEKTGLEDQLEELARHNKRTTRLLVKRQLLVRAESLLRGLLEVYEKQARQEIEREINGILEVVAHKDYRCRFTDNFAIELVLNDRATPKSGGENQLLSLVFIASLVKFSRGRIDLEDEILRPGTMAPLVLDAPLGQLDPDYQESVAEYLPKLAQQVVLLVSGSQGGERVLKRLEPAIAREYVLVQHNDSSRGQKKFLRRTLRGREHDLIIFNAPKAMTTIEEL